MPNATDALQEIDRDGIDIVFSDIVMPGEMDGLALAAEIKQRRPDLPVLLTTGYSNSAREPARFPILRKPYELQELSRALSSVRGR